VADYKSMIEQQVNSKPIFIYMKGTPGMPMCGFSARATEVLSRTGVEFGSFNIFDDMGLFEELKNEWPTSPQIYVKGEFVGGCDIICELFENGELATMLQ
jgi:monothiol glutaredoxin